MLYNIAKWTRNGCTFTKLKSRGLCAKKVPLHLWSDNSTQLSECWSHRPSLCSGL